MRRAGFCLCGHVLDHSRHIECRHCTRARALLALCDPDTARVTIEAARARLARGRDVIAERPRWSLDSLLRHVRPVVRS